MGSRLFVSLLALGLLLFAGQAEAKPTITVLAIGGDTDETIRAGFVHMLEKRYVVLHGDRLLDACDALGIPMSRGRNLARCATEIGSVAVVGGALRQGYLSIAIYSGKTGLVLNSGTVPCADGLTTQDLRKARKILLSGLKKAPRSVGHKRPKPPPPKPAPIPEQEEMTFEAEPVTRGSAADGEAEEDPLDQGKQAGTVYTAEGESFAEARARRRAAARKAASKSTAPKVWGVMGLGTWHRRFTLNDPANIINPATNKKYPHPGYDSGFTFAMRHAAKIRPGAFFRTASSFLDSFISLFYLRMHFQTTIGLESRTSSKDANNKPVVKNYGTTFYEFLMDVGVDWKVCGRAICPHLETGLGFGVMEFAIDWGPNTPQPHALPDASYRFALFKVGMNWPFWKYIGAHFFLDSRVVTNTGELEDPLHWYGPASAGGISTHLGIDGQFMGFIASVEHSYNRYFYSFNEGNQRRDSGQRAAGGALDELHAIMINLGYSY